MKNLLTLALLITFFFTPRVFGQKQPCPQNDKFGNSSGGGGDCKDNALKIPLAPPAKISACVQDDQLTVKWRPTPLDVVSGYDVYSCDRQGAKIVTKDHLGYVPSSGRPKYYEIQRDPEITTEELLTNAPQDLNTRICVVIKDNYKRKNQISEPVPITQCKQEGAQIRSSLMPPSGVRACFMEGGILIQWHPLLNNPVVSGYKVYACRDADFQNGEPSILTLQKNWVDTTEHFDGGAGTLSKVPDDPSIKFCVAAFNLKRQVGHVSQPVAAQHCN